MAARHFLCFGSVKCTELNWGLGFLACPRGNDDQSSGLTWHLQGTELCTLPACTCHSDRIKYGRHWRTNGCDSCKVISGITGRLYNKYLQCGVGGSEIRQANAVTLHEKAANTCDFTKATEGVSGPETWQRTEGGWGLSYGSGIYNYQCWWMWRIHSDNKTKLFFCTGEIPGITYHSGTPTSKSCVNVWNKIVNTHF
jgi:hypothetical protein